MPEIVVDNEDPAVRIMRKVIEKKQEWWDRLKSYKAEAYCRTTFSNDTGIVLIRENISAISLGIGSVLLGITLDYSLHILTHFKKNNDILYLGSDHLFVKNKSISTPC